ncbi:hypothetical protein E8E11_000002, partial [Didymella keratinophila]
LFYLNMQCNLTLAVFLTLQRYPSDNQYFPNHEEDDDPEIVNASYDEGSPDYEKVIKLYIFGDKYDCRDLRSAALDFLFTGIVIQDDTGGIPASTDANLAFQNLSSEDFLYYLLIDVTMAYDYAEDGAEDREEQKKEEDLANLSLKLCDYREHADDEERKACEMKKGDVESDQSYDNDSD